MTRKNSKIDNYDEALPFSAVRIVVVDRECDGPGAYGAPGGCGTLVAHNVAFDYAFLAAEARRAGTRLPVDEVMCTVELARRLNLGVGSLKLAALAHHWNIAQTRPHDALDDALVLVEIFQRELAQAQNSGVALPIRHPRTLEPPVFEMRGADLLKAS